MFPDIKIKSVQIVQINFDSTAYHRFIWIQSGFSSIIIGGTSETSIECNHHQNWHNHHRNHHDYHHDYHWHNFDPNSTPQRHCNSPPHSWNQAVRSLPSKSRSSWTQIPTRTTPPRCRRTARCWARPRCPRPSSWAPPSPPRPTATSTSTALSSTPGPWVPWLMIFKYFCDIKPCISTAKIFEIRLFQIFLW